MTADPGCLSRIRTFPSRIQGSKRFRIRIKEFKFFNLKELFLSSRKYDPGCSSRIWIPDPDLDFLPISDLGSRGEAPDLGSGSATMIFSLPCSLYLVKHGERRYRIYLPCCGSGMFILGPNFFHPDIGLGSWRSMIFHLLSFNFAVVFNFSVFPFPPINHNF
jgi:hypothetical protein